VQHAWHARDESWSLVGPLAGLSFKLLRASVSGFDAEGDENLGQGVIALSA